MKRTIALATRNGWQTTTANPVDGAPFGLALAVHRTPGKTGWSVTELSTGMALASGKPSQTAAVDTATGHLLKAGEGRVRRMLAACPPAPVDLAGLPAAPPPGKPAARVDLSPIVTAVLDTLAKHNLPAPPEAAAAIRGALSSSTGRLKERAPVDDWSKAAWNGLQPNAFKVQVGACMFLPAGPREFMTTLATVRWPSALDSDRAALEAVGAW